MINDHKTSADFDDEVLNKLDALLYKHQNQVNVAVNVLSDATPSQDFTQIYDAELQQMEESLSGEVPTLTEIVVLLPLPIQIQSERSLSLQQILDVALKEVKIEMNTSDRIALTKALEKHLSSD